MEPEKEIRWVGSAYKDLLAFPASARRRDVHDVFRVIYVTSFEAVYVLHCFRKKARTTSHRDKAIAAVRYRSVTSQRISAK